MICRDSGDIESILLIDSWINDLYSKNSYWLSDQAKLYWRWYCYRIIISFKSFKFIHITLIWCWRYRYWCWYEMWVSILILMHLSDVFPVVILQICIFFGIPIGSFDARVTDQLCIEYYIFNDNIWIGGDGFWIVPISFDTPTRPTHIWMTHTLPHHH